MLQPLADAAELVFSDLQLPLFALFSLAVWSVWGYKLWLSRSYRPIVGSFKGTVSIMLPTFREDYARLHDAILSALRQQALEVIVLVDEREPETQAAVQRDFEGDVRILVTPPGKRIAVAEGVKAARGDIVMVTASDVRLEVDTVKNLIMAFTDPRVGGACGYTRGIIKPGSLASLTFFWITEMRGKLTYRALGARRQIQVLDGECFAVRRRYWVSVIERYLNQRFLGVRPVSGDDGWITTLLLEDGWQTAYQETARAHTYAPATFAELITQQLRWNRNSTRRCWYSVSRGIAHRTGLPYFVHTLGQLFKAPFFSVLVVMAVARSFGLWQSSGDGLEWAQHGAARSAMAALLPGGVAAWVVLLAGFTVTKAVRSMPRYQRGRLLIDLLLVPVYALIGTFVLMPLRLYGTITARRISWGTRSAGATAGSLFSSAATAGAICVSLAIPMGLLALVALMIL